MARYIVFRQRHGGGFHPEFVDASSVEEILGSVQHTAELFVALTADVTRARRQMIAEVTVVDTEVGPGPVNEAVTDPRKLASAFTLDH
jgi:hypothetical protein